MPLLKVLRKGKGGEREWLMDTHRVGKREEDTYNVSVPLTPPPNPDPVGVIKRAAGAEGVTMALGVPVTFAAMEEAEGECVVEAIPKEMRKGDAVESPPVDVGIEEAVALEERLGRPLPEMEAQVVVENVMHTVPVRVKMTLGVREPDTVRVGKTKGVVLPLPLAIPEEVTAPLPLPTTQEPGRVLRGRIKRRVC